MSDMAAGNGSGATPAPDPSDLRALVREVLREALPAALTRMPPVGVEPQPGRLHPVVREASVGSDAELDALVRSVARECEDPVLRAQLADGTVRYRLAATVPDTTEPAQPTVPSVPSESAGQAGRAEPQQAPDLRVERGAVTERHVRQAERDGARVVAARGVVVTPLARDRARSTGVDIAKEQ